MSNDFYHVCAKGWESADLSSYKPLGFDLLGWVAIATAIITVAGFCIKWLITRKPVQSETDTTLKWRPWRRRFPALCKLLSIPMNENSRIFREFGPNSGSGQDVGRVVKYDVKVWNGLLPTIVLNNGKIGALIRANQLIIPARHSAIFAQWINHIDAFSAHVADPDLDYREYQFPAEIVNVVHRYA